MEKSKIEFHPDVPEGICGQKLCVFEENSYKLLGNGIISKEGDEFFIEHDLKSINNKKFIIAPIYEAHLGFDVPLEKTSYKVLLSRPFCPVCGSAVIVSDERHNVKKCGVCSHQFKF